MRMLWEQAVGRQSFDMLGICEAPCTAMLDSGPEPVSHTAAQSQTAQRRTSIRPVATQDLLRTEADSGQHVLSIRWAQQAVVLEAAEDLKTEGTNQETRHFADSENNWHAEQVRWAQKDLDWRLAGPSQRQQRMRSVRELDWRPTQHKTVALWIAMRWAEVQAIATGPAEFSMEQL